MTPSVSGVRDRREEHHVRPGQRLVEVGGAERAGDARERHRRVAADDGHLRPHGPEQVDEALGDASRAEDRGPGVVEAHAGLAPPRRRPHPLGQGPQAAEGQGQGVLGDGFGVDALAAGPAPARAVVGEDPEAGEILHAGPRQLHPPNRRRVREEPLQVVGAARCRPHERLGVGEAHDLTAAGHHRPGDPGGPGLWRDGDPGRRHGLEKLLVTLYRLLPVANIKSQIKRNKQNETRRLRNKAVKSEIKTRVKSAVSLAAAGTPDVDATKLAIKRLDKAVTKGIIHKNQAARRKSRLMKRIASLSSES